MTIRQSPTGTFNNQSSATLVSGATSVATPVPTNSAVFLTRVRTAAPTVTEGELGVLINSGRTSFTINSSSATDVSVVNWIIL
jgi:hypothetical protein